MRQSHPALLLAASAVALLLFPLGSYGRPADENTWSGTWNTNFGVMTITQSGSTFSGTYSYEGGKVTANIAGNVATGTWGETPTYAGPNDAGPFKWTMSAGGKSWSGTWSYAGGGSGGNWSGTCTGGACLKNGEAQETKWRFSVNAHNKLGSRTVGSGTITKTERGAGTTWRTTGTVAHVDEYFTKAQEEMLTLRVVGGRAGGYEALLEVVVTRTSHPRTCALGRRGVLYLRKAYSNSLDEFLPARADLRVCGREHDHRYTDKTGSSPEITIRKITSG